MDVYITHPKYGKLRHGRLVNDSFIRDINGTYVRWSDHSFLINVQILPRLKKEKTMWLKFKWATAHGIEWYKILLSRALEMGETVTNEVGEDNLRIPIIACTKYDPPKPPAPPPVEIGGTKFSTEVPKKPADNRLSLF